MNVPDALKPYLDRPVALLGDGRSGRAARALLAAMGIPADIYDQAGAAFDRNAVLDHRLVIVSPGFAPGHPWVRLARWAGLKVLAEMDLAALCWPGRIIAITGTNGKSTLTHLLAAAFNRAGHRACVAGNIGRPLADVCLESGVDADTVAVCEVSSFQAEVLHHLRPEAALWTNFAEDHLDRHGSMARYFAAKANLLTRVRGVVIVGQSVREWAIRLGAELPDRTAVIPERLERHTGRPPAFRSDAQAANLNLARAFWAALEMPPGLLEDAAYAFSGLPHRLEVVAQKQGVVFWNDSKATNFHAALAAVSAVEAPVHWIGGGKHKGGDVAAFCRELARYIASATVIGEAAPEVAAHLEALGVPVSLAETLPEAIGRAWDQASARYGASAAGAILLSPGFPSLDQFEGFAHRGEIFNQSVFQLIDHCPVANPWVEPLVSEGIQP